MKINRFIPVLAAFMALILFVAGCNAPATETAAKTTEASGLTAEKKAGD